MTPIIFGGRMFNLERGETRARCRSERGEGELGCLIALAIICVVGYTLYSERTEKKQTEDVAMAAAIDNRQNVEANAVRALAAAKTWRWVSLPNIDPDLYASLNTSWRNGKLFYRFQLQPKSVALAREMRTDPYARKYFIVALVDESQFGIVKINVPLRSLTRIVDKDDNVLSYEANDSIECDRQSYEDLRDWAVQWSF